MGTKDALVLNYLKAINHLQVLRVSAVEQDILQGRTTKMQTSTSRILEVYRCWGKGDAARVTDNRVTVMRLLLTNGGFPGRKPWAHSEV